MYAEVSFFTINTEFIKTEEKKRTLKNKHINKQTKKQNRWKIASK